MSPLGMTLVFIVFGGVFAWSAARRWQLLLVGAPEPRFTWNSITAIQDRVIQTLVYAFGQKKMPQNSRYRMAGLAHVAIFAGFNVLLINSLMLWARGFDASFDFWGILSTEHLLGQGYSFAKELAAAAAAGGAGYFVYLRLVTKPKRMSFGLEGLIILFIIITMMLADFIYVGGHVAREAAATGSTPSWHWYEPIGSPLAMAFAGMPHGAVVFLEHLGFWYHAAWVLAFLNLLPFSKHFHIITVMPNVFADHLEPKGKLPDVDDIEGKIENDLPIGMSRPEHMTWKGILDLYTCTECGRCSDNCPAYTTGKKLSPKHLTLALRDHLYDLESHYVGGFGIDRMVSPKETDASELHVHGDPPEGYHRKLEPVDLIGDVIAPEVIWACTTCRACEEQCPVNISYVDKIVEMRRHEMMIKNEFPHELEVGFRGLEVNGNPWNLPAMDRGGWAEDLGFDVPTVEDAPDAELIYWVGCAANYDDQAKKVARSFAKLMNAAEVEFAIMGSAATCTGDPARRAGNEYLFQMLAESNVEALNECGATKKKIVTACPHCFNSLANEYPSFGGRYDVIHHSELLAELIKDGKLTPEKKVDSTIAYHDSCYLGRYNEVYDAPREVLSAIPGVTLEEVEYWNRERGLCCGAGGAQMFKEEEEGEEAVFKKRTLQLLETNADTIASGCPFCATMLTDGLKAVEKEEDVAQLDIAQILEKSVRLPIVSSDS